MPRSKQRIFADCDVAIYNRADPLTAPKGVVGAAVSVGLDAPVARRLGNCRNGGGRLSRHRRTSDMLAVDRLGIRGPAQRIQRARGDGAGAKRPAPIPRRWSRRCADFKGLRASLSNGCGRSRASPTSTIRRPPTRCLCRGARRAGRATRRHIVLIAGGDAKNADLSPLREPISKYVRHVVTLGKDAAAVEAAVAGVGRCNALRRCVKRFGRVRRLRAAAISCCCRRRARASTCSRTSRRAGANSPQRFWSFGRDAASGTTR